MVMQKQLTITDCLTVLDKSLENFRNLPKEEQKQRAIKNLIKTGVLNTDGTPKKVICTID